jgi:hypothetical protein
MKITPITLGISTYVMRKDSRRRISLDPQSAQMVASGPLALSDLLDTGYPALVRLLSNPFKMIGRKVSSLTETFPVKLPYLI